MKINKIYVVGALHGNEVFALKVLTRLELLGNPHIVTRVGNAEAVARRTSYIQSDLNRSFGALVANTQEKQLAQTIIADIERHKPDLIIDVHSAIAEIGKVGILASDDTRLQEVVAHLGMDKVAVMPEHIHKVSLIGQYPHASLSLDFGKGLRSDALAVSVATRIAGLIGREVEGRSQVQLPVYLVQRTIRPEEAEPGELVNYVFHERLGGYPFLASARGYKDYRGFLAVKKDS